MHGALRLMSLLALATAACARGRCPGPSGPPAVPAPEAAAPPTGAPPRPRLRYFNDGEFSTLVTRPENVFAPGMRYYDVADLLALDSPEYDLLAGLPDLAVRRHGATYADISLGWLRVAGSEETHRFVGEALEVLRRTATWPLPPGDARLHADGAPRPESDPRTRPASGPAAQTSPAALQRSP